MKKLTKKDRIIIPFGESTVSLNMYVCTCVFVACAVHKKIPSFLVRDVNKIKLFTYDKACVFVLFSFWCRGCAYVTVHALAAMPTH